MHTLALVFKENNPLEVNVRLQPKIATFTVASPEYRADLVTNGNQAKRSALITEQVRKTDVM